MQILANFGKILGQCIVNAKSFAKFSPNINQDLKEELKRSLKMKDVDHMSNHLGVLVDIGRRKKEHFQFLVDKISTKVMA